MEVSLGRIQSAMRRYDRNGDGKMSQSEAARASIELKKQGEETESAFFATLALGGKDGEGLFPDFNRDGKVSISEVSQLANSDGKGDTISVDDFKTSFFDRYQEGGVTIDDSKLQRIANQDGGNPFDINPSLPGNPFGNPFPGSGFGSPFGFLPGLFSNLFNMMQQMLGSGGQGQPGGNGQPGGFFFFFFRGGNPYQKR